MKDKLGKITKRILMIIQGFIPLIVLILVVNLAVFVMSLPITNVNLYSILYNKEKGGRKNLLEHFPTRIPESATDIQFYYIPQVLQGGMKIKLEFKASKEEIDSYIEKYKDKYTIRNFNDSAISLFIRYGIPDKYGINLNENRKDITIYILETTGPSNHGKLAFIAVNDEHTEILFQAERW